MDIEIQEGLLRKWKIAFSHFRVDPIYLKPNHPCLFCGGEDRATLLDTKGPTSVYLCRQCGKHSPLDFMMKYMNWDFVTAKRNLTPLISPGFLQSQNIVVKQAKAINSDKINRLLKGASASAKEITSYLEGRGIGIRPDGGVYFQPKAWGEGDDDKAYAGPAIIFAIKDAVGNLLGFQKIFIKEYACGWVKAPIKKPKQITVIDGMKGGMVRLFNATNTVGVAEGVETALSCSEQFNIPVWSALTAVNLTEVQFPKGIKNVTIFSDNDENFTGQQAAYTLAKRLHLQGIKVDILISKTKDFLDDKTWRE